MKKLKSVSLLEVLVWMVIVSIVLLGATQIIFSLNNTTINNSKMNRGAEGVALLNSMVLSEFTHAGELPTYTDSMKRLEFSNGNIYSSHDGYIYVALRGGVERELFEGEFKELTSRALTNGYEYSITVQVFEKEYDLKFFYSSSQY